MDALQFETEIKGTALRTLEQIQSILESISKKTTITLAVEGFEDFKRFIQSDDFKNIAKNISSAFGGKKAQNVEQFFTNLRNEIEKVKTALKTDDFSTFMNQIEQLTKQFSNLSTEYERFLKSTGTKTGSNLMGNMSKELGDIKGTITQTKLADGSLQQLEQTTRRAEKASRDFEKQQKKQEEQTRRTNEETNKQSSAISQLESMMGRYLSIYAVGRFASEMAQITGELELQKRSLEVIIGNASMANELYGTIRDMSQMSPYTFQDLMKSTRQLSAFGIETKDLYGTMKALSDIGAGLSVDVQRLILAYGHTRSYGYLSGIQNRQFETAGIDMIGGLADRYNRLADAEERAGRAAEHVTRKDVFKRMAKRDISFEDVNAVIMDLDREGGKFFNMQERQFETLGGKLRNLRNNYNIMMSEMGEQNKGILRAGVNLLNELTGNWEKYGEVIKTLIWPLGALKLAMIAVNQTGVEGAKIFSRVTLQGVQIGFGKITSSIKNILTSSTTWITAAIAAIAGIITHFTSMSREAERVAKSMAESAERSSAEIDRILQKYNGGAINISPTKSYVNGSEVTTNNIQFNRDAMRSLNLGYELEELKRKLQSMSPFYEGDLVDIFKLQSQEEQFEAIIRKMESYRQSGDILSAYEDVFADSSKGGFFKGMESLETNLKDYADNITRIGKRLREMRDDDVLTPNLVDGFNEELNGILGDGNLASKVEELRNYFVSTLSLSEDDRYQLFLSWSQGLRDTYIKAMDLTGNGAYQSHASSGNPWRFGDLFRKSAVKSKSDLEANIENVAKGLETALANVDSYETRIATMRTRFTSSMEGANLSADVSRTLFESLLRNVSGRLGNDDYTQFLTTEFMSDFGKSMSDAIKNNPNWTQGQAFDAAAGIAGNIKEQWIQAGRDVASFWGDGFVEELQTSAKSMVSVRQAWQEELQGAFKYTDEQGQDQWGYSEFYNAFTNRVREATETDDIGTFFGETMKKVHDDMAKTIENLFKPASKKWGINIEPDLKVKTGNLEQLKKVRDDITKRLDTKVLNPAAREGLENLNKELNKVILLEETAKEYGFEYGDDKKSGYGSGYHDEYAKRWDERIRIMKEAYDWYDKWEKKVGESEAFKKVDERYRDIFDEWKTDKILPFDFQATDIKDYFSYVEQIRDQALAKYQEQKNDESKNNGQEALRVYRQAVAVLEEGGYDNFIRAAEKFQSIMEKTMDDLQRRWSLFTDIRDKTGNVGLAASLSGVDTSFRTQADAMRAAVQNAYTEAGGEGEVNFDISLDKEAVRAMFEGAIRGDKNDAKYMESIDGLIKGFEEWQNAQEEQEKMDINVTVDLLSSAVDFQSEVARLQTNYNRQSESLKRLFPNGGADYDKAKGILDANYLMQLTQAEEGYKLLMDGVSTMSHRIAERIKKDYIEGLTKQLEAGAITAKDYADGIQAISEKMAAVENQPGYARSFFGKGFDGISEVMSSRAYGLVREGKISAEAGSKMMIAAKGMSNTVAIIDMIIHGIDNAVQGFKNIYDRVQQLNVALGNKDADEWSDMDTFLTSFSNASSAATRGWDSLKQGDIMGAIDGTIGSWTEWFKGFAEGEDKKREYQIKLSERQLKALSNMESRLDKIAERTLGYGGEVDQATWDKFNSVLGNWTKAQNGETYYTGKTLQKSAWGALGSVLLPFLGGRIAENIYDKQNTKQYSSPYSNATVAAIESALQTGSLYAAQYAAKMMERDELESQLKQLEAENKKDDARIEETKQKLWDVKQDLAYWTEDLAKELWGIDIKGWADQISSALTNAFSNGENAAKAFDDTVRGIMQNVVNEIIKVGLIEPMMADLRKTLFGTKNEKGEYEGGAITQEMIRENPKQAGQIAAVVMDQWRKDRGDNIILSTQEVWTGINTALGGFLTNPNANTLSSSIQGTSEETSDLLAGYVSALRQDVAAERILREQFIMEMWPTFVEETMGAVIQPLNQINLNVAAIRQSMTGQGELIQAIDDIYLILNAVTNGSKELYVR